MTLARAVTGLAWIAGITTIVGAIVALTWWGLSIDNRISVLESQSLVSFTANALSNSPATTDELNSADPIKVVCADLARTYASLPSTGSQVLSGAYDIEKMMQKLGCIK